MSESIIYQRAFYIDVVETFQISMKSYNEKKKLIRPFRYTLVKQYFDCNRTAYFDTTMYIVDIMFVVYIYCA